jgi:hypothetical protein
MVQRGRQANYTQKCALFHAGGVAAGGACLVASPIDLYDLNVYYCPRM